MPLFPTPHEASLIPFLGGLIAKAAPFVRGLFAGGIDGRRVAAVPQLIRRTLPVVTRALAPVVRRAAPVAGPIARIVGAGAGFGAGAELVQRGFKITIDRRTGQQRMVRIRRMNAANVRALRRALRRVKGFEGLARRVGVFTRGPAARGRRPSRYRLRLPKRRRRGFGDAPLWLDPDDARSVPYEEPYDESEEDDDGADDGD